MAFKETDILFDSIEILEGADIDFDIEEMFPSYMFKFTIVNNIYTSPEDFTENGKNYECYILEEHKEKLPNRITENTGIYLYKIRDQIGKIKTVHTY